MEDVVLDLNSGPPPEKKTEATLEQHALCQVLQVLYPPTDEDDTKDTWFERACKELKTEHKGWPLLLVNTFGERQTCGVVPTKSALSECRKATKRKREFMCAHTTRGVRITAPVQVVERVLTETDKEQIPCVCRYNDGNFIATAFKVK